MKRYLGMKLESEGGVAVRLHLMDGHGIWQYVTLL